MPPVTHIINRQKVGLRYNGAADSFTLRQMVSRFCSEELPARLVKLLDRYDDKDRILHIGRLDVALSISDDGALPDTLGKAIIDGIEAELRKRLEQTTTAGLTIEKSFARALRFYLENGYVPWWSTEKDRGTFLKAMNRAWESPGLGETVREFLPALSLRHARTRLLGLLDGQRFDALIRATGLWKAEDWAAWKKALANLAQAISSNGGDNYVQLFRLAVLEAISALPTSGAADTTLARLVVLHLSSADRARSEAVLYSLTHASVKGALLAQVASRPEDTSPTAAKAPDRYERSEMAIQPDELPLPPAISGADEHISIGNAGLVLVALYLPQFFSRAGLVRAGSLEDLPRAVSLLRYLVFEDEPYEEFDLILEKILCGLPLSESIDRKPLISRVDIDAIDTLLQSVIEHWTVLKNTTPAGLRHNFLRREGRLTFKSKQWELTVQKEAHDILLDYLPWNIRMIKLPWMPELLTVRW